MHRIVITDGFTLNPGDLNWSRFHQLGEVRLFDRTYKDEIVTRCREAPVIVTNKTPIDANTINACRDLKMIAVTATGYNVIDVAAAKARGVVVCNVPAYGTDSVAQHTFALLLELTNHVGVNSRSVYDGEWYSATDWCYSKKSIVELRDKAIGVIGFGRIGQQVARIAAAFGMRVLFHSSSEKTSAIATSVSLEDLFRESDVISLHLPLTKDNHAFVDASLLSIMKPSAFLINTSRGQLINESDLSEFLRKKKIAGAALDVLSVEPPVAGHPLIGLDNCMITPHNAWLSVEARQRMMNTTLQNIECFLKGAPQNVV